MATSLNGSGEKDPLLSSDSQRHNKYSVRTQGVKYGYKRDHGAATEVPCPPGSRSVFDDCIPRRDGMDDEGQNDGSQHTVSIVNTVKAKVALIMVTICYFLGYIPSMVIMNPFIYDRVSEEYTYQVNISSQVPCGNTAHNFTGNTSEIEVQNEIERRVSTLELYLHLTTYLPAILPILLLGPFTDRLGRRIGFLLPILGTLMKQIVYIIVIALKLPVPLLYLAHAIEAVGGSFAAMLSAIFSVTSDVTKIDKGRSGWIAVIEALQTLAASLGQVYTAQWMRLGYLHPLICALGFCCLALFLAIFLLPETRTRSTEREIADDQDRDGGCCRRALQFGTTCWNTVQRSVTVYIKDDKVQGGNTPVKNNLCRRRLCLAIFILTVAVNFSRTGVEALFQLKYPLCWAATRVYTFNGLRIFFSWIAILIVLALMQKIFKMADRHVAMVGVISSILSNAAISLASNDVMVYEASAVGFMTRSIVPMLRSLLSSLVGPTHQGAMYSSLSCVESLGASVFSTAANRIYYASLSTWAGEIFMIFACIMFVALILLIIMNILFSKERTRTDRNHGEAWNIQNDP